VNHACEEITGKNGFFFGPFSIAGGALRFCRGELDERFAPGFREARYHVIFFPVFELAFRF
jgi:hypothetical protein